MKEVIHRLALWRLFNMKKLLAILSVVLFANQAGIEFMNGTT